MRISSFSTWGRVVGVMLMLGLMALFTGAVSAQDDSDDGRTGLAPSSVKFTQGHYQATSFVPVIVTLNTGANFQAGNLAGRTTIIQSAQTAVLNDLAAQGISVQNVKSFRYVSAVAMSVNADGLRALQRNPMVAHIAEDSLSTSQTFLGNNIVGAPSSWSAGFDGTGFAVAIFDTGVDGTHPAFAGKIVAEGCFNSSFASVDGGGGLTTPVVSSCPNGEIEQIGPGAGQPPPPPECGQGCDHGTHVAGIAAGFEADALADADLGDFSGVAPGADVIGVNVFSLFTDPDFCASFGYNAPCPLSYDSDQLRGMEYILSLASPGGSLDNQIAAINMSLGGGRFYNAPACDAARGPAYVNILDELNTVGVAVVASSGNSGYTESLGSPGCLSGTVSVGSTTNGNGNIADQVSTFSNSATFLDILAPGQSILSTVPIVYTGDGLPEGYAFKSGTSMAAPYIAGAFAIMRQAYPNASIDEILDHLQQTGTPITDTRNGIVKPRLQVDAALFPAAPVIEAPLGLTLTTTPTLTWHPTPLTDSYTINVFEPMVEEAIVTATVTSCTDVCTYDLASPLALGDYSWTVVGANVRGDGQVASGGFSVTNSAPSGQVISSAPTFAFVPSGDNATYTYYNVSVSDGAGNEIYSDWFPSEDICTATQCVVEATGSVAQMLGDNQLEWSYAGYNASTQATDQPSTPVAFTVLAPSAVSPTPTDTVDDITGNVTITVDELVSSAGDFAEWYRVYLYKTDSNALLIDRWFSAANCLEGQCSFAIPETVVNGEYTYWMQGWSMSQGYSAWSTGTSFTATAPTPPYGYDDEFEGFNLAIWGPTYSPNDIFDFCPDFGSEEDADVVCESVDAYMVVITDTRDFVKWFEVTITEVDANGSERVISSEWVDRYESEYCGIQFTNACHVPIPTLTDGAEYNTYLRSYGAGGAGDYAGPGSEADFYGAANFRVALPAPVVVAPTEDAILENTEVTFEFTLTDAAWYNIYVAPAANLGEAVVNEWIELNGESCEEGVCSFTPDTVFTSDNYTWFVGGYNEIADKVVYSSGDNFSVQVPVSSAPELFAPADDSVQSGNEAFEIIWFEAENTSYYNLVVRDESDTPVLNVWLTPQEATCEEGCSFTVPAGTLESGTYNWFVRTYGPGNSTEPLELPISPIWTVTIF